jgi:FAD/FMN-containing dehydrogenase
VKQILVDLLGAERVLSAPEALAPYREDFTEIDPCEPDLVALVTTTEEVQAILREANARRVPVTARVYGTNIGGLALATEGGVILDLTRMDRIHEVNVEDMYAVIEPGVTQRSLKDHLTQNELPLTLGYSLAPPDTSVFANALLGGLTNRSLKYGDQSLSISALEVVRADGTLVRTGSWAVQGVPPFGRVPLPDLTGLVVGWQGTTGIATRMAYQLWPLHPLSRRLFFLAYSAPATYSAMSRLCKKEMCEDIGGLSWPSAKMMMGVQRPHPFPSEGEPTFFLYLDLAAEIPEEMAAKEKVLSGVIAELRREGHRLEGPLDVAHLVRVAPALSKFAEFPTELDFLTQHGGGGLTWVGTYGPLSRFAEAAEAGAGLMTRHGFAPLIVSRPMRGGHYGVLRFIATFDKKDPAEVAAVRAMNRELLALLTPRGFLMYKTPIWAWRELEPRMDPGMRELLGEVKRLLDPERILNPGKLGL